MPTINCNTTSFSLDSLKSACNQLNNHISFHIPGHKGNKQFNQFLKQAEQLDLTELPGLDDLYDPKSHIKDIEKNLSQIYGSNETIISTNGASSLIIASLIELGKSASHIIIPRNCHVSVINGLILTSLTPIWLELDYCDDFKTFTKINLKTLENLILKNINYNIGALLITQPSYAGYLNDVENIASLCAKYNLKLIVDEAHGAHLPFSHQSNYSGLKHKADIVIHSLHKTLSALSQAACLHLSERSGLNAIDLKQNLKLISTTSPSYLIMLSIEDSLKYINDDFISKKILLMEKFLSKLKLIDHIDIFNPATNQDIFHILIKDKNLAASDLMNILIDHNIYPEGIIGDGLLLMPGIGTSTKDVEFILNVLPKTFKYKNNFNKKRPKQNSHLNFDQVMSPSQAYTKPSRLVKTEDSLNLISAQTISKCPPGIPILVPGAKITNAIIESIDDLFVKVVDV